MVDQNEILTGQDPEEPEVPEIKTKGKEEQVSQNYWALVWWKFKKNKLAVAGGIIVALFYIVCFFFAEFFAP